MNAKTRNASYHKLFLHGGKLDILLWGYQEMDRQVAVGNKERREVLFGAGLELIAECPCGCGLKDDICEAHRATVKALDDEIPF